MDKRTADNLFSNFDKCMEKLFYEIYNTHDKTSDIAKWMLMGIVWYPDLMKQIFRHLLKIQDKEKNPRKMQVAMTKKTLDLANAKLQSLPSDHLACKKGCNHCCNLPVACSVGETLVIADHLRKNLKDDEMVQLRKRMKDHQEIVKSQTGTKKGVALCPLNVEGSCSVYEVRPMVCRQYTSTSAEACQQAKEDFYQGTTMGIAMSDAHQAVGHASFLARTMVLDPKQNKVSDLVPSLTVALDNKNAFYSSQFPDPNLSIYKGGA